MFRVRRVLRSIALIVSTAACAAACATPASAADRPTVWGCLPGAAANPCEGSLETTYLASTTLEPRRIDRVETPPRPAERPVDCFYVYPTVVSLPRLTAPHYLTSEVKAILEYQAARFSQVCDVYAPVYRQVTAFGLANPVDLAPAIAGKTELAPSVKLAYGDVLAAWRDYLAHHNRGRGVVLVGHSQGAGMLMRLIKAEIDGAPQTRAKIVSAVLPGGNLVVKRGERAGGDFQHIPVCASRDETGCALAWSSYSSRPSRTAFFGQASSFLRRSGGLADIPGTEAVCVNPAELSGDRGVFEALSRRETFPGLIGGILRTMLWGFPPYARTPWVSPGERYRGECAHVGTAHVLRVRPATPLSVMPIEAPWPDWGLHFFDLNLPLGNIIEIVESQARAYSAAHATTQ